MQHIAFTIDSDRYGNEYEIPTFKTPERFTNEKVIIFLEKIQIKQQELLFYDKVKFSDFYDDYEGMFFEESYIDKKHFSDLYNLYLEIKDDDELFLPFIKYIVKTFNDNCIELPF